MSPGDSTVLFRAPVHPKLLPPQRRAIREFAAHLTRDVSHGQSFTCLICGDTELHALNKQFLAHDYPTDVLSFPSLPGSADLGEIAISTERASSQAAEFHHQFVDEIRILMLHGLLHLTGLDHETDGGHMASVEARWRLHFALPHGLIERSHGLAQALAGQVSS